MNALKVEALVYSLTHIDSIRRNGNKVSFNLDDLSINEFKVNASVFGVKVVDVEIEEMINVAVVTVETEDEKTEVKAKEIEINVTTDYLNTKLMNNLAAVLGFNVEYVPGTKVNKYSCDGIVNTPKNVILGLVKKHNLTVKLNDKANKKVYILN